MYGVDPGRTMFGSEPPDDDDRFGSGSSYEGNSSITDLDGWLTLVVILTIAATVGLVFLKYYT